MIAGLPYDAEVEYLESTGTQWIDTGVKAEEFYAGGIALDCMITGFSSGFPVFYGVLPNDNCCGVGIHNSVKQIYFRNSTKISRVYDSDFPSLNITSLLNRRISYSRIGSSYSSFKCDGVEKLSWHDNDPLLYDFATSAAYKNNLGIFAYGTGHRPITGRLFSASVIGNGGGVLRKFVPVRFTNELGVSEGALYDRVSRKLFRNAGTGAFVIGPDIATPVMGLHFMPKPPPYDAEVDYLESTGTQYIDTGLWFTEDTQLECVMSEGSDLSSLSTGGGGSVTGSSINGYGQCWRYAGYSKSVNGNFYWDGNVVCDGSFMTCTMDSSRKVYRNGSYLFDACVEGYHNVENQYTRMYIMAQLVGNGINPRLYRVRSFKVVRSGTTIIDAKAVRFTNEQGVSEGAMYDNVSKQLFRNAGTGAFLWAEKQ